MPTTVFGVGNHGTVYHLRIISPEPMTSGILDALRRNSAVIDLVTLRGVSESPTGDLIECDLPRESTSEVLDQMRALGVNESGSITLTAIDTATSRLADEAQRIAPGSGVDAVVWEEVERRTSEESELSWTFIALMIIAAQLAAVAIVIDSLVLVVGAMVVGPEFGPIAGLAVAGVQRRRRQFVRSLIALVVGFPIAIASVVVGLEILQWFDSIPPNFGAASRPLTGFISHPDEFSVIVALLAGIAGTLSLTSAKSGPLIGVLVSVTTIPAAGNIGVGIATSDWGEARGASLQLVVNLLCLLFASTATLFVQRRFIRWNYSSRTVA